MGDRNGSKPKDVPGAEVAPKATRRSFTREYKLRIVREAAESKKQGGIGALLRREGLYSTLLVAWRREFEQGGPAALEPKRRETIPGQPWEDGVPAQ
jgi:transposase